MPELLWKSYIDFEIEQEEPENARQLFERMLERTMHVKVNVIFFTFFFFVDNSQNSILWPEK